MQEEVRCGGSRPEVAPNSPGESVQSGVLNQQVKGINQSLPVLGIVLPRSRGFSGQLEYDPGDRSNLDF